MRRRGCGRMCRTRSLPPARHCRQLPLNASGPWVCGLGAAGVPKGETALLPDSKSQLFSAVHYPWGSIYRRPQARGGGQAADTTGLGLYK